MAIALVGSMCPMVAYAQPSQENSIEEGVINQDSAELEDDQAVDAGNSSEQNYGEKQQVEPESESTDQALVSEETAEEQDAQDLETDTDPDAENSWRYSNGEIITSSEGANPDTADLNSGIMPFSMVENPAGYKVFNWFDKFNNGYYTGTNAYKGIDVSYHNGNIDWAKVKASGVDYAIIRCGYGMDERDQDDEKWLENVQGCIENNIPFGVYLYSYATNTSRASSEADHVLRLLREAGLDSSDVSYPIYFDMEDASTLNSDHAAIATTFCNKIEAAGYVAGVYSSTSWFNDRLTDSCFNNWTKWVAQWNASSGLTYDGLSDFSSGNGMWQFSDYGSVPGISGAVDLNYTCMEPVNLSLDIEGVYTDQKFQLVSASDSNLVLTVDNNAVSGSNVSVSNNANTVQQNWFVKPSGNGFATFYSVANSSCVLDAAGSNPASGSNVSIWDPHGGNNQKWLITPTGNDQEYIITVAANNNLALGINGSNVEVQSVNNSASQKWIIKYNLSESSVSATGMQRNATGSPLAVNTTVTLLGKTLEVGKDYTILYDGSETAPSNPGSYKISIKGIGNYTGTKEVGTLVINDALNVDSEVAQKVVNAKSTDLVLDAAHNPPVSGANVAVYKAHGGANQAWFFELQSDGYYIIRNAANKDLILDAASSKPVSGANVSAWEDNGGGLNQRWIVKQDGKYLQIINAANNSLVLDAANPTPVEGSNVSAYEDNGGGLNQHWNLVSMDNLSESSVSATGMQRNATGSPLAVNTTVTLLGKTLEVGKDYTILYDGSETAPSNPGSYKISIKGIGNYTGTKEVGTLVINDALNVDSEVAQKVVNAKSTDLVLDAAHNPPVSGANVAVYKAHGGANQAWFFELQSDGYYIIRNAANKDLILDAASSKPVSGANVSAWEDNGGGLNQRWIVKQDGKYLQIINAANNSLVLDAANPTPVEGSNVSAYEDNGGGLNQHWNLVSMSN